MIADRKAPAKNHPDRVVPIGSSSKPAIAPAPSSSQPGSHPQATPSPITVRHAAMDDTRALYELFSHPMVIYWTVSVPYLVTEDSFQSVSQPDEGKYTLIAQGSSGVMGSLAFSVNPLPRCRHSAHVGAVAVHPHYQGRGVGHALMRAVVDLADNWLNLHRLDLMVFPDNEGAIALYKKYGFISEGVLRDYAFRAGSYCDVITMARFRSI